MATDVALLLLAIAILIAGASGTTIVHPAMAEPRLDELKSIWLVSILIGLALLLVSGGFIGATFALDGLWMPFVGIPLAALGALFLRLASVVDREMAAE